MNLTKEQIEKASKLALKGMRELTEAEKDAIINANKAKKSKLRGKSMARKKK